MPPEMARRRPTPADARNPDISEDTTSATSGGPVWHLDPFRGPYRTELGILTDCPLHPWDVPNLSLKDQAAPVCFTTGHVWDEADARRAAR